jgi:hypothetical protein
MPLKTIQSPTEKKTIRNVLITDYKLISKNFRIEGIVGIDAMRK